MIIFQIQAPVDTPHGNAGTVQDVGERRGDGDVAAVSPAPAPPRPPPLPTDRH